MKSGSSTVPLPSSSSSVIISSSSSSDSRTCQERNTTQMSMQNTTGIYQIVPGIFNSKIRNLRLMSMQKERSLLRTNKPNKYTHKDHMNSCQITTVHTT